VGCIASRSHNKGESFANIYKSAPDDP
jgi:hypothetical protein